MEFIKELPELRSWTKANSAVPRVVVPTMGALHEGHLSLCDRARQEVGEEGHVVVTIFVNPTQFGPTEDLDAYPRQLEKDLEACKSKGVDLVFSPPSVSMYHSDASVEIHENSLSLGLCGASRPGHFTGVCTVVAKLFNLIQPDAAVFGEKDFQQLAVIRRMTRDLNFPVRVIGSPTVRESDGLAMSSRNAYLEKEHRAAAPIIYCSLSEVRDLINSGKIETAEEAIRTLEQKISISDFVKVDYLDIVHPETLVPLKRFSDKEGFRIIVAVFFGRTRLIDNLGSVV